MIGRFYIPDSAKDRLNQGFVKYRGPDTRWCQIGDYVLFSGYSGTLTFVEGEGKFIIMPEAFIIATIDITSRRWEIPGLYFREASSHTDDHVRLFGIITKILPDLNGDKALSLAGQLAREGVHVEEPYFLADYETAMQYLAKALGENKEFRDALRVTNEHPPVEDYDKLGAGAGRA